MASKNAKSKSQAKVPPAKKRQGLSKWEMIAIPIIIIVAVWSIYSFTQPPQTSSSLTNTVSSSVTASGQAPDFTLPVVCSSASSCQNPQSGLTNQMLTLSAFKGKVVLLEFMEPWCPHCQDMAPVLANLYSQYGKANVVFISVAGPWNGATGADAMNFIAQYGSGWTYVYDSSGTIFSEYGVDSTPTFYIISPDLSVSTSMVGEQGLSALGSALTAAGAT